MSSIPPTIDNVNDTIKSAFTAYSNYRVPSDISKYEAGLLKYYSYMHHTLKNTMFARCLADDFKTMVEGGDVPTRELSLESEAWVFNGTRIVTGGSAQIKVTKKSNLKVKFKIKYDDLLDYNRKKLRIPTPFEYNFNDCYEIVAKVIKLAFIEKGLINESAKLTVTVE